MAQKISTRARRARQRATTEHNRLVRELQSTRELADRRWRDLTTAQGLRDELRRSVDGQAKQIAALRQGPQQYRTVRRTVIFSGEAIAVARQLAQSLPLGVRRIDHELSITVLGVEDVTLDVVTRG